MIMKGSGWKQGGNLRRTDLVSLAKLAKRHCGIGMTGALELRGHRSAVPGNLKLVVDIFLGEPERFAVEKQRGDGVCREGRIEQLFADGIELLVVLEHASPLARTQRWGRGGRRLILHQAISVEVGTVIAFECATNMEA
jgi:hypothetical protein